MVRLWYINLNKLYVVNTVLSTVLLYFKKRGGDMTKKYRVIGYPIGHTMSPFIQKELFKLTSFDGDYEKLEIAPEQLKEGYEFLKDLNGFNVTIPHKTSIIPLLDRVDPSAAEYGAVNTVSNENGEYVGYNTDAYGFLKGLEFCGIPLCGKVMVYGYGGAARTIITESVKAGCEVTIGTTEDRIASAQKVAEELSLKLSKKIFVKVADNVNERYDLFINASPVGMYPNKDASPIAEQAIGFFNFVYDIVYNPTKTKLIKFAEKQNKVCGCGMSMLVCQAQKAQSIWYGASFTKKETKAVIEKAEKELKEVFGE